MFDYHSADRTRAVSSVSSSGALDRDSPLFSTSLRVAWMKRVLSVRYQTLQEVVSEVSGSWAICMLFGVMVTTILEFVKSKAMPSSETIPCNPPTQLVSAEDVNSIIKEQQQQ